MTRDLQWSDYRVGAMLALAVFLVFNANGREIPSYDSQPTKFAAREFLLRGTLALNYVVGHTPQFIERAGFQLALDGSYRSAYSPVPAIAAAVVMWPLTASGIVDLRAPGAPAVISAVAASMFVAAAVGLSFLTVRRWLSQGRALALAITLGLGTGWWSTASQTLWQHEVAILGLTVSVFGLCALHGGRDAGPVAGTESLSRQLALGVLIGAGLGLAGGSRQQLMPVVAVLAAATLERGGWRCGAAAVTVALALLVPVWVVNLRWFGSVLGAAPMLEGLHEAVHGTSGSFSIYAGGYHGLLFSPSRGLLIFSPVVALTAIGLPAVLRAHRSSPMLWCGGAAALQFTLYGSYVVWWGGHTYGPRYMLDLLPLLVPIAVIAANRIQGHLLPLLTGLAMVWSIGVAGLGAFVFPHERWNTDPADVDRHHERLWEWSDAQIVRCWRAGPSPQNYSLLPERMELGGR